MRTPRSALVSVVAVVLSVAVALPVSAETARERRERAKARQAELARRIDALKASDAELQRAVRTLDAAVRTEVAKAHAASQALDAANLQVGEAEGKVHATEAQIAGLRADVVTRAVNAYVNPSGGTVLGEMLTAEDISDAGRRSALLAQVANRQEDALDALRAARQDFQEEQDRAAKAREVAAARQKEVTDRLNSLKESRAAKVKLDQALQARIAEALKEADLVAAQESSLTSLIRQQEATFTGKASSAGLIWPVKGRLTSGFGRRWGRLHAGIDVAAPTGTPIKAAKDGVVIFAGRMSGYGNTILVNHGGGLVTLYAHQSRLGARVGQQVDRGELIGYVGSTGRSTGPHLHFETRVNGSPRNPRNYL